MIDDDEFDDEPKRLNQIDMISALFRYIEACGVKTCSQRQMNTIIAAVDSIIEELKEPAGLDLVNSRRNFDLGDHVSPLARCLANHESHCISPEVMNIKSVEGIE